MKILVVSSYPPAPDGIASYAVQSVAALRAQGHDVEVLSPGPSAAHHHLDLVGPRGALALAKRLPAYDRVVVQFHPDFFFPLPPTAKGWAVESAFLAGALRAAKQVHVVVHEIDYRTGRGRGPLALASRALWRSVDQVLVHTERERTDFIEAFGVKPARVRLLQHGGDFTKRTTHDRASARRSLGLPQELHVFLSIGFIQRHKGFDRGVQAFAGLDPERNRLVVVGSARLDDEATAAYVSELTELAEQVPGAQVHVEYVSDELFDRWVVAADTVVLPYRSIWSSSVLERATLYGRPVIVTDVGGLAEQAGDRGVTVVADDEQLAAAMRAAAGVTVAATVRVGSAAAWPAATTADLRDAVQAQVQVRAAAGRRGSATTTAAAGTTTRAAGFAPMQATAPLRRLPVLAPPSAGSTSFAASLVKRVVRKLTAWEIDPLVQQLNALQSATTRAVERAAEPQDPASR